jgi:phenylpyruvate tautomerase PptA (4-oxalocrotonate tautomerase family)
MSSARVYVPAGALTPEQRRLIVKGIHETINRVEQRPANAQTHTYVIINEVLPEDWGSDGNVHLPKT